MKLPDSEIELCCWRSGVTSAQCCCRDQGQLPKKVGDFNSFIHREGEINV